MINTRSVQLSIGDLTWEIPGYLTKGEDGPKISIDLESTLLNDNLSELLSRERGTVLRADEATKKLFKVQGFKARFSYARHKTEEQAKVAHAIQEVLQGLETFLQGKRKDPTRDVYRFVIRHFFGKDGTMGRLSKKLFEEDAVEKESALKYFLLSEKTVLVKCGEKRYYRYTSDHLKDVDLPFPLSLEMEDKDARDNFWALLFRKKGEIFTLNPEGTRLQKVVGIRQRVAYWWKNRNGEEEKKVKNVISTAFQALNQVLSCPMDEATEKTCRIVVAHLFSKKNGIGRLSKRLFDANSEETIATHSAVAWFAMPVNTVRLKIGDKKHLTATDSKLENLYLKEKNPIDWSSNDEKKNAIFWHFLKRKQGEHFSLSQQDTDELIPLRGLRERVWYWKNKESINEMFKMHFQSILTNLDHKLSQSSSNADTVVLQHFFDQNGAIGRLSRAVFDRISYFDCTKLQDLILPLLNEKKAAFKTAWIGSRMTRSQDRKKVEEALKEYVFAVKTFALIVGVPLEKVSGGGSGGARIGFDPAHNKILAIKPGDEGPHGINNPQWYAWIKRLFIGPRRCLKGNDEPLAENDSYAIDRAFGLNIVPPTDLRLVESMDFVGDSIKDCSIQMWVNDCETLKDHLEISGWIQTLPRGFLRWYFGGLDDKQKKEISPFIQSFLTRLRSVLGGEALEKRIDEKIPRDVLKSLFERVGVHNFLIEDIDCHFENILVRIEEKFQQHPSIIESLFDPNKEIPKEDEIQQISTFVDGFFTKEKNFQKFLGALFFSKQFTSPSKEVENMTSKKISLIKHDGGSSNPHHHPSGYLSSRYKHLFEVLPHFRESFSEEIKTTITNDASPTQFLQMLEDKAHRALKKLFHEVGGCQVATHENFELFWETHIKIFRQWIIAKDVETRKEIESQIIALLTHPPHLEERRYKSAVRGELERIHNNLKTRIDSWEVLRAHLKTDKSMRKLFKVVKGKHFHKKLAEIPADQRWHNNVSVSEKGLAWKEKHV